MPSSINKWHIHHDKSIFTIADNVLSVYHMISKVVIHYVQSRSDIIIFKYIILKCVMVFHLFGSVDESCVSFT